MPTSDSLDLILNRPAAAPKPAPPPEDAEALSIADMHGAAARPASKALTRLHVIDRAGRVRTFQYSFLDVESRFEGDAFTLVFAGSRHWQVTVRGHGRLFWAVYDYITLHRWPYLREAQGSMPDAGQADAVFTFIEIKDVTPKQG